MMPALEKFLHDNLLILAVGGACALALIFPAPGKLMDHAQLSPWLVFCVFFCQGASVDLRRLPPPRQLLPILAIGFAVSQVLAPLLALGILALWRPSPDYAAGFFLMACMAPTLVSGTVISGRGGGCIPTALGVTIVINLSAVLTVPLWLRWGPGGASLDSLHLLGKLLLLVLLPAVLGQLWRRRFPERAEKSKAWLSHLPVVLLSLTIYINLSVQAERMHQLSWYDGLSFALAGLVLHIICLWVALRAGSLGGGGLAASRSLAVCCSQKTLPVAVTVWSTSLALSHPLALLPCVVFHFMQIWIDGLIAGRWSKTEKPG
jgi:bile acid:Na+ symporter, BASS family